MYYNEVEDNWLPFYAGDRLALRGTVKAHDEYRGTKADDSQSLQGASYQGNERLMGMMLVSLSSFVNGDKVVDASQPERGCHGGLLPAAAHNL